MTGPEPPAWLGSAAAGPAGQRGRGRGQDEAGAGPCRPVDVLPLSRGSGVVLADVRLGRSPRTASLEVPLLFVIVDAAIDDSRRIPRQPARTQIGVAFPLRFAASCCCTAFREPRPASPGPHCSGSNTHCRPTRSRWRRGAPVVRSRADRVEFRHGFATRAPQFLLPPPSYGSWRSTRCGERRRSRSVSSRTLRRQRVDSVFATGAPLCACSVAPTSRFGRNMGRKTIAAPRTRRTAKRRFPAKKESVASFRMPNK